MKSRKFWVVYLVVVLIGLGTVYGVTSPSMQIPLTLSEAQMQALVGRDANNAICDRRDGCEEDDGCHNMGTWSYESYSQTTWYDCEGGHPGKYCDLGSETVRACVRYYYDTVSDCSGSYNRKKDDFQLPSIDSEMLIMGLRQTESLISSGRGKLHWSQTRYGKSGEKIMEYDEFDAIFAFDSYRDYYQYQSGLLEGRRELVDKKLQMRLDVTIVEGKIVGCRVSRKEKLAVAPEWEPRNWGLWFYGVPLSQYLQKHGARIIGSKNLRTEKLKKNLCYVVETNKSPNMEGVADQFWIIPEGGFRCVQLQIERGAKYKQRWKKRFIYKTYKMNEQTIWFLKKGLFWIFSCSDNHLVAKIVIEVKDFQPNVDISDLFHLEINPETPVWDETLSKFRPFKEIGWKP